MNRNIKSLEHVLCVDVAVDVVVVIAMGGGRWEMAGAPER